MDNTIDNNNNKNNFFSFRKFVFYFFTAIIIFFLSKYFFNSEEVNDNLECSEKPFSKVIVSVPVTEIPGYMKQSIYDVNKNKPLVVVPDYVIKAKELVQNIPVRLEYLKKNVPGVEFKIHLMYAKETLLELAEKQHCSMKTISGCNPQLESSNVVQGQQVMLASKNGVLHIVKKDETWQTIAAYYNICDNIIIETNKGLQKLLPGEMLFIPDKNIETMPINENSKVVSGLRAIFVSPIKGRITSKFGMRRSPFTFLRTFHNGIDIAAREETIVRAPAEGIVTCASEAEKSGLLVSIDHQNGYTTYYGHLSHIYVRVGQKVKLNQAVGKTGSTGRVTGPHLHFMIKKNNIPQDPLEYISPA